MTQNIKILDGQIMKKPECVYDFLHRRLKPEFDRLMQMILYAPIHPSVYINEIKIIKMKLSQNYICVVPSWMIWLMMQSKYRNVIDIATGMDEWHYAKEFINKTVDEHIKRCMILADLRMCILENDSRKRYNLFSGSIQDQFDGKGVGFMVDEIGMYNLPSFPSRLEYGKVYKFFNLIYIHVFDGMWWFRLWNRYGLKFKNIKHPKTHLLFSERRTLNREKVKGQYLIGNYIIKVLTPFK